MKPVKQALGSIFILGAFIALANLLSAQETAAPIQAEPLSLTPADVATFSSLSEAQLAALVSALDQTPLYSVVPGTSGTFYSFQHPDWPPLPADLGGTPVWSFNSFYLLNDVNYNYNAAPAGSLAARGGMQALDDSGPPSPGDGGGTNLYAPMSYTPPDYGTNLFLVITNVADNLAGLLISNTQPGVLYEIQALDDLSQTGWVSAGWAYGSELTNWTPASVVATNDPALFFRVRSWADDGSGLPLWWQEQYFGTTGVDPYGDPEGDGWNNLQKFQNGWDPNVFYTPPAPQGLAVSYNPLTDIMTVSWQPSSGPVVNYTVSTGSQNYPASTSSYQGAVASDDYASYIDYNDDEGPVIYGHVAVQANYAGGSSAWSAILPLEANAFQLPIYLLSGQQGAPYLAAAALPPNVTSLLVTRLDKRADDQGDSSYDTNFVVPVSGFTNGLYALPASWEAMAPFDSYGSSSYAWWVQTVDAQGNVSGASELSAGYQDDPSFTGYYEYYSAPTGAWPLPPYFDGRQQLKQNLIFLLRAGLTNSPATVFEIGSNGQIIGDGFSFPTNNYAVASFYELNTTSDDPGAYLGAFFPFGENYLYRNFVFNFAGADSNGILASFDNYFTINNNRSGNSDALYLQEPPAYQFQPPTTGGAAVDSLLATNQTRWLFLSLPAYADGNDNNSPIGMSHSGETNLLAASFRNRFGLPFLSTEIAWGNIGSQTYTLYPGDSTQNGGWFYSETAQPQFQTVEYDFLSPNGIWDDVTQTRLAPDMPGFSTFSPTDQSQMFIAPVGSPIDIAGYAKLAVQNGYTGVYGYLGQYFDQAYKIVNGAVTTNTTGVLSSYGSFFATEPGPAALVTIPDPDTGERGTCTVYCVSAVIDRTQGSNMDISFSGANTTSQANPATVWCDNNYDRWHTVDGNDSEQDDLAAADLATLPADQQVPDCQYTTNGLPAIPCTRDLEDYFRLWLPGVSAAMKAMPSNYTVQLTLTGDGQIRIFKAIEPDGGTNYVFDETTASNQVANSTSLYVGLLTSSSPVILPVQTNFNEHFIFCGAQVGSAQIDLQVLDENQNVIADAPLFLQINDIKNMYERWMVGDNGNVAPLNYPVLAANDMPDPMQPPFQYIAPQDTNTPYILFVHGWNMSAFDKDRFAETAFKRLYWQGYHGRFGSFRWPTYYDFPFGELSLQAINPENYDDSEFNAWKSGASLRNFLLTLDNVYPNNVYLMAHSMGNVVAGEALRTNTPIVNTYIAMQAAVPAHAYDPAMPTRILDSTGVNLDSGTPNRYAEYYTSGAPCYFNSVAGAGTYVNFFNTNDWALTTLWEPDQDKKPDINLEYDYHYDGTNFSVGFIPPYLLLLFPVDTYDIFAHADEARCYALGALGGVGGVFSTRSEIDLFAAPYNFKGEHKYHSGEFRSDNAQRWQFWNTTLVQMRLK